MTFWKEETLEQQRKHLQATTRWQAQTTRMQPHFTNLAWWSFNQLAKPTQTHLLEFEVNVCTNLNPHCHIKDWKTFWQETTPTSRKPKEVLVKLESLRATNSCHDGCMFTRINKFLNDLHVDWRVDFAGIWLFWKFLGVGFLPTSHSWWLRIRANLNWRRPEAGLIELKPYFGAGAWMIFGFTFIPWYGASLHKVSVAPRDGYKMSV